MFKKKACYEPLTYLQLVFAETGETMSGGNFHGEYPAKVKLHSTNIHKRLQLNSLMLDLCLAMIQTLLAVNGSVETAGFQMSSH